MCHFLPIFCWATKCAAAAAVWYGERLLPNWYLHILPLMVRKFWPKKLTITSFLQPTSAIAMPSKPTMAPTRNAAFSTSISSVALRLATSGLNSESRMTVSTLRPITPPAALMSSTAIWVAASISWASRAIGPVWGTTTPTLTACWPRARRLTKGNPETAVTAPAPARVLSIVRREVGLIVGPPLRGCEMCRRRAPLISRPRRPRPLPRRGRRGRLSRRHGPRPARRPHPRPDHPRARGGLLRRDASDRRARGGARLRLDLALRPLPDPRSRGLRGGRGHRARGRAAVARGGLRLDAAARVLDRALRPRSRHAPAAPRHQRALPLLPRAVGAGQDGGDPGRDQRRPARPGPRRGLVRAGVPRLRRPVPAHRGAHRPARGGHRDHPADVDRAAPELPGLALRRRRRDLRPAAGAAAPPADLDRRRGRSGASPGRAGGGRRQRALVGAGADRRAGRLPRRGLPRGRARAGRAPAIGHRAARRGSGRRPRRR